MRLYSTWHRTLVDLPSPPHRVGIYTCGPTVYQRIHVGNARPFVLSMWLKRWLEQRDYEVLLVENITDVNDKIYDAAPGDSARLAAEASAWYIDDTNLLGLGRPDVEPKATETIPEIVGLIAELVASGHAYAIDGDVYFRVARFAEYGGLSGQKPDQMRDDEPNPRKEDTRDFALWKGGKPGEDTAWESPWGRGRPGWHIECSAMAEKYLGPSFDIHMGGLDLVFPHHENEIAQSRAAGREFARIWMHNGMLEFTGEKMSKSVGNVVTLRDAVQEWGREALLLLFLTGHWRKPLDFSGVTMTQAKAQWATFLDANTQAAERTHDGPSWDEFVAVLDDDFNTPAALAVMHEWRRARNLDLLGDALQLFGLAFAVSEAPLAVKQLARRRLEARAAGDYAEADRLRAELDAAGWEVRDEPAGYRLVPKR